MVRSALSQSLGLVLAGLLACGGGGGGAAPQPPSNAPTITSVTPPHAAIGATVTLNGTNLGGVTSVAFNDLVAFSFKVESTTQVSAVVPPKAATGSIRVTTSQGGASSPLFTVDPPPAPSLDTVAPSALLAGGIATLTGTHFVGATQVRFNGMDAASFTVINDTQIQATTPLALSAGVVSVTTPGGTAISTTGYSVTPAFQSQALMNPDFEWSGPIVIWQGDTAIIQGAPGATGQFVVPHSGSRFAWMGGYGLAVSDHLTQDVWIPDTAMAATLSFYLKILTEELGTTAADTFKVAVLDTQGALLATLFTRSNLDASDYTAFSVDLLPFRGRTVRLSFTSQEDAQSATSFLLDDLSFSLSVPTSSDLKPFISSFTPTSGIGGEGTIAIVGGNFFGLTEVKLGNISLTRSQTDGTRLIAQIPSVWAG